MEQELSYVGIDVAKDRVDVAIRPSGEIWSEDYDEAGIGGLVVRLQALGPVAVVLEATGGLEVPLASALAAAALPVAVVNPRQVRDFAKATGRLAKTDALDAQVLAHFAEAVRPPVRQLPDDAAQELSAMTTRPQPGDDHAGGGEEPPEPVHPCGTSQHPSPHRVAGAGTEGPGRRSEAGAAPQSGMAGEGRPAALGSRGGGPTIPFPGWPTCRNWAR